jgi:flavorubredoxin
MQNFKSNISRNLTNARGWKTNRKIVVFESDDWGSMRMPSNEAINNLEKKGILLKHLKYATLDTLENKSDILDLREVLMSNPNSSHQIPVFTTNMVLGNPDYS